jgi:importin subunit alpha-6/7
VSAFLLCISFAKQTLPIVPPTGSLVAANRVNDSILANTEEEQEQQPGDSLVVLLEEEELPRHPDEDLEFVISIRRLLSVPTPPIELVVRRGIIPRLVSFLHRDNNPVLQREAAWILGDVASGTFEQTDAVVEGGAVPHLVRLLGSSSDDVREKSVRALGLITVDSPHHRDAALKAGAIDPLLRLLMKDDGNKSLIRRAARALSELCSDGPDIEQVRPALPVLAGLLHHPDHKVVEEACWTFSDLLFSFDDDLVVQEIIDADSAVAARLVELVSSHRPRVQLYVNGSRRIRRRAASSQR